MRGRPARFPGPNLGTCTLNCLRVFSNLAARHLKRGAKKFSLLPASRSSGAARQGVAPWPTPCWTGLGSSLPPEKRPLSGSRRPGSRKKPCQHLPGSPAHRLMGPCPSRAALCSGKHHAKSGVLDAVQVRKSNVAVRKPVCRERPCSRTHSQGPPRRFREAKKGERSIFLCTRASRSWHTVFRVHTIVS